MAALIKNIPNTSFAVEGNKGINFPLKGQCLEFNPVDLKNCPLFIDPENDVVNQTPLLVEDDSNLQILMPCDLASQTIDYVAQGIIEFDNVKNFVQLTFWGSSNFYTCLYKGQENFVMYSGSTVSKTITKNQLTSLVVTDETGPREFRIKMNTNPKDNQVYLVNTLSYIPIKTVLDPKIAGQYNLVSTFKGGSSTITFAF